MKYVENKITPQAFYQWKHYEPGMSYGNLKKELIKENKHKRSNGNNGGFHETIQVGSASSEWMYSAAKTLILINCSHSRAMNKYSKTAANSYWFLYNDWEKINQLLQKVDLDALSIEKFFDKYKYRFNKRSFIYVENPPFRKKGEWVFLKEKLDVVGKKSRFLIAAEYSESVIDLYSEYNIVVYNYQNGKTKKKRVMIICNF
jgi:hypothetical protein